MILRKVEEFKCEYIDDNFEEKKINCYRVDFKTPTAAGAVISGHKTKCALSLGFCINVLQIEILAF